MIRRKLAEAHLCFPSYGERTKADVEILAGLFVAQLTRIGLTIEEIAKAFDHHMCSSDKFPTISDIVNATKTVTCYRMDFGPLGFGAVYHADHPYIRNQMRITGTDLSGYAVNINAIDADRMQREATHAPAIEYQPEDNAAPSHRPGSGFRRLSYDHLADAD